MTSIDLSLLTSPLFTQIELEHGTEYALAYIKIHVLVSDQGALKQKLIPYYARILNCDPSIIETLLSIEGAFCCVGEYFYTVGGLTAYETKKRRSEVARQKIMKRWNRIREDEQEGTESSYYSITPVYTTVLLQYILQYYSSMLSSSNSDETSITSNTLDTTELIELEVKKKEKEPKRKKTPPEKKKDIYKYISQKEKNPPLSQKPPNSEISFLDDYPNLEIASSVEFRDTMVEFLRMRKSIKKPMTERAKKMLMNKLIRLADTDKQLAIAILEQSIYSNWQDIYPLKSENETWSRQKPRIDYRLQRERREYWQAVFIGEDQSLVDRELEKEGLL